MEGLQNAWLLRTVRGLVGVGELGHRSDLVPIYSRVIVVHDEIAGEPRSRRMSGPRMQNCVRGH